MAHNVERMMYVRQKPWHGLGTMVQEAPTSADALRLAGLDWTVEQNDIFRKDGTKIPGIKENYRSTDGQSLGIVSDRYRICQNTDAFSFTDNLIGTGDVRYETAGSLRDGRHIWLLARLKDCPKVMGDDFENYIVFSNTHDGSGAIRCAITPVRVVCNNTLNIALQDAKRSWSTKHVGDIQGKLDEAENVLFRASQYLEEYQTYAERLANTPLSMDDLNAMLDALFPAKETDSDLKKKNMNRMKGEFMTCYFMPDIKKFQGTQWGALNAMSDLVGHTQPMRKTKDYASNNWGRIMVGHELMDNMMKLMQVKK